MYSNDKSIQIKYWYILSSFESAVWCISSWLGVDAKSSRRELHERHFCFLFRQPRSTLSFLQWLWCYIHCTLSIYILLNWVPTNVINCGWQSCLSSVLYHVFYLLVLINPKNIMINRHCSSETITGLFVLCILFLSLSHVDNCVTKQFFSIMCFDRYRKVAEISSLLW